MHAIRSILHLVHEYVSTGSASSLLKLQELSF